MNRMIAALAMAGGFAAAAPALADTFADFSATSSQPNLRWTHTSVGGATGGALTTTGVADTARVYFSFLTPTLATLANLPALFTLNASSSAAASDTSGLFVQPDLSGAFSFVYSGTAPLVVGSGANSHTYLTGANLLSGSFSGAEIVGSGSTASLQDSIVGGGSVFFSTVIAPTLLPFSNTPGADQGLSLALTSILPPLRAAAGQSLASFTGNSTGSFAADLSAGGATGGAVPEPATWAMMLLGFGAIGLVARRRVRTAAAVA